MMRAIDLLFGRVEKSRSSAPRSVIDVASKRANEANVRATGGPLANGNVRIGYATGRLRERGHVACPQPGTPIDLDADAMYGGTLAIGPMGVGKTRGVLQPFVGWFLQEQTAGMFAYGVKPNWSRMLARIARFAGRRDEEIHVLGPGKTPWPLLRGLPPEAVATFVKAAFNIGGKRGDQFFTDGAANAVRRAAQIAYASTACAIESPLLIEVLDKHGLVLKRFEIGYNLSSIAEIVHAVQEADVWSALASSVADRVVQLVHVGDDDAAEMLADALDGLARMLLDKPEKTVGSVVMQVDTVIEPFISSGPLRRAFCAAHGDEGFVLGESLDAGHVVIVDVDLAKYDAAARLAYLLAFEQLRSYMLRRIERIGDGEVLNPVAFVADEYAEVAVSEHKKMWRICREAMIAPIVAYQLQSDLRATVGGRDDADAMVAGFSTKILFRTDDAASVSLIGDALGKAEVERTSTSEQEGTSSNFPSPFGGGSGTSSGTSDSRTSSTQIVERLVVDAQLAQNLRSDIRREVPLDRQTAEALVITTLGSRRIADVVTVRAWDPPGPEKEN